MILLRGRELMGPPGYQTGELGLRGPALVPMTNELVPWGCRLHSVPKILMLKV